MVRIVECLHLLALPPLLLLLADGGYGGGGSKSDNEKLCDQCHLSAI
jgi:hypothetical protein